MLSLNNCALSSPNGAIASTNGSPWICATVLTTSKTICLNFSSVYTPYVSTLMTFCMSQKYLGQNILLSSNRCLPASIRMGTRSTPASHDLAPTNFNTWVITSLGTVLCPNQINSSPFKPLHSQRLANNCASSSVWSTYIVTCGKITLSFLPH